MQESWLVVFLNIGWKLVINLLPLESVDERASSGCANQFSLLSLVEPLRRSSQDGDGGDSGWLNDLDVNILGGGGVSAGSLASVNSGVSKPNVRVSDELFRDCNRLEVVGQISSLRPWVMKPFNFRLWISWSSEGFAFYLKWLSDSNDQLWSSRVGLDCERWSDVD